MSESIVESTYTANRKSYRMDNGYQIIATKVNDDIYDVCIMEGSNISVRPTQTDKVDGLVREIMAQWGK